MTAKAEAEYQAFIRANLKRNYAGNYLHGMLGMTGFRLVNAPTFVPAYLHLLSGSDAIVGLGMALQQVGQVISPALGAAHVEHRKEIKPVAMRLGTLMRLPILLMAIAGWTLQGPALLVTMLFLLLMLGLFSGAQRVVFQVLLAKMIPVELRGRLQAFRNFTGGLIAAGLSWVAGHYLIEGNAFGNGYATTFLIAFVLTSLGLLALRIMMREPIPPSVRAKMRLRDRMKDMRALVTADRDYRNFLIAQMFAMGTRLAAPFYILHVAREMPLTGETLGLLSLAYLGADTVTNLIWGYFGDRSGFRWSFIAALALGVLALTTLLLGHSLPLFLVAFVALGASASGYMMSSLTMVLEFGNRDDTPMRLAISSTVEGIGMAAGPLIGGVIAVMAGYTWVFAVAASLQLIALGVLMFGVREPRLRPKPVQEEPDQL